MANNQLLIPHIMPKIIFIKYLPPFQLKMLRIYQNLAHPIFQIFQSRFGCQKWFLLNIYHLLGPNWSQNQKYLEFIKIWHIGYFKYASLGFSVENVFLSNIYQFARPKLIQKWKMVRVSWDLIELIFQICRS